MSFIVEADYVDYCPHPLAVYPAQRLTGVTWYCEECKRGKTMTLRDLQHDDPPDECPYCTGRWESDDEDEA